MNHLDHFVWEPKAPNYTPSVHSGGYRTHRQGLRRVAFMGFEHVTSQKNKHLITFSCSLGQTPEVFIFYSDKFVFAIHILSIVCPVILEWDTSKDVHVHHLVNTMSQKAKRIESSRKWPWTSTMIVSAWQKTSCQSSIIMELWGRMTSLVFVQWEEKGN